MDHGLMYLKHKVSFFNKTNFSFGCAWPKLPPARSVRGAVAGGRCAPLAAGGDVVQLAEVASGNEC